MQSKKKKQPLLYILVMISVLFSISQLESPITVEAQSQKFRIGIEAGHTLNITGAPPCEAGQKGEEIITKEVALVLKQILVDRGYDVDIFRGDEPNTLPKSQITGYDADAFIALHTDYCAPGRTGFKVSRYGGIPGTGKNGSDDDSDRFIDALWKEYYSATLLPKNTSTGNFTLCMTHYWALNPIKKVSEKSI